MSAPWPRVAVCSWSLEPRTPAQLIDRVRAVGLDRVQLDLLPLLDEAVWAETPTLLAAAGISIESGMLRMVGEDYSTLDSIARTGGVRPNETWPANLDRCERAADLAGRLGLPLVTFHAGFLPHDPRDPERSVLLDRLRQATAIFARHSVAVGLETGQESAETLGGVLAELAGGSIGVNFDPANMLLYGMGDPVEALRRLAPQVVQLHVKDALPAAVSGEWGRETPFGEGEVDWRRFIEVARGGCPGAAWVIERESGTHRVAEIHHAVAGVRALAAQVAEAGAAEVMAWEDGSPVGALRSPRPPTA